MVHLDSSVEKRGKILFNACGHALLCECSRTLEFKKTELVMLTQMARGEVV